MADGNLGSRIFAIALLSAASAVSYQGWKNSKLSKETAELAKQHACDLDSSCIVMDQSPRIGAADVLRHRYEYNTTHGVMTVTCKRELLFFGAWNCVPSKGRMVENPMQ